jgi:transcriptional regulator
MGNEKSDVLHGSLALMVLRTLDTLGPQHGWGIARRIEQISGDALALNQGTLYPALLRMEQMGWISSKWGASDNNRRARFYAITRTGKKQLATEAENWERVAEILGRFLRPAAESS